ATNFTVGKGPVSIAVNDFNGDGKLDLAVANVESEDVSVLIGTGAGGFGAPLNLAIGVPTPTGCFAFLCDTALGPNSVAAGDLNGDGKSDLAVSNARSGTVSVLLGNGTGGFSTPTDFAVGTQPVSVVVSDFNGDGKKDLAIANHGSNDVSILINTCSSAVTNP